MNLRYVNKHKLLAFILITIALLSLIFCFIIFISNAESSNQSQNEETKPEGSDTIIHTYSPQSEKSLEYKSIGNSRCSVVGIGGFEGSKLKIPEKSPYGETVVMIGKEAFAQCFELKEIIIPESVTSIGVMAFSSCSELESITIPSSVTSIGYSAFISCDKLNIIYCKPVTPPSTTASLNINSETKIFVPVGSSDAYKTAANWSKYASMIEELEM